LLHFPDTNSTHQCYIPLGIKPYGMTTVFVSGVKLCLTLPTIK
jgi:hypothetical protein